MIKLELYKLKGVDDVAVAISANVNNFFGLFTTHYFTNFSPVLISIWKGKRSDQKKCVVTSFDWNYNECSHFAMIKLKLFKLEGVDDVDVGHICKCKQFVWTLHNSLLY